MDVLFEREIVLWFTVISWVTQSDSHDATWCYNQPLFPKLNWVVCVIVKGRRSFLRTIININYLVVLVVHLGDGIKMVTTILALLMITSSNGSFDVFFESVSWINSWVNTREAIDVWRYRTHYDVTVMLYSIFLDEKYEFLQNFCWMLNKNYDLRLNKQLSKQSWGWWFETPLAHYDVSAMRSRQNTEEIQWVKTGEYARI